MESEKVMEIVQDKIEDNMCVWQEFRQLGLKYGAVSLGEGAPYLQPPKYLVDNLVKAVEDGNNQYTSCFGHPEARKHIAEIYSPRLKREIDPNKEVLITNGANGSLNTIINACLKEGDEMIVFEPYFPQYLGHVQLSKGSIKSVAMYEEDGEWKIDLKAFEDALSDKTRLFLHNTPHNPTGKIFTKEELEQISDILEKYPRVVILSDEVYDFLCFDGKEHYNMATIRDNWWRTVTTFSGGKMFCATGWKVGWTIGPHSILKQAGIMNDTCTYCHNVPGQIAIASSLKQWHNDEYKDGKTFPEWQTDDFNHSQEILLKELGEIDIPFKPIKAEGGYFIMVDISECMDLVPEKYLKR